jgi:hypothetical protein
MDYYERQFRLMRAQNRRVIRHIAVATMVFAASILIVIIVALDVASRW